MHVDTERHIALQLCALLGAAVVGLNEAAARIGMHPRHEHRKKIAWQDPVGICDGEQGLGRNIRERVVEVTGFEANAVLAPHDDDLRLTSREFVDATDILGIGASSRMMLQPVVVVSITETIESAVGSGLRDRVISSNPIRSIAWHCPTRASI